jgi:hypothetical protein
VLTKPFAHGRDETLVLAELERDVFTQARMPGAAQPNHAARPPAGIIGERHDLDPDFGCFDPHAKRAEALREPGRAEPRRYAGHAQRKPEKIWRRSGKSQLRKVARAMSGLVANAPPRRTR